MKCGIPALEAAPARSFPRRAVAIASHQLTPGFFDHLIETRAGRVTTLLTRTSLSGSHWKRAALWLRPTAAALVAASPTHEVRPRPLRCTHRATSTRMEAAECLASSSWHGFFDFEGGDGGIGAADVDVGGSVPGDGFVGADVILVGAVGVDLLGVGDAVVDLLAEEPLVFHGPEAAFA